MTMKTEGFLLFAFAFASVLSSSEVLTLSKSIGPKIIQPLAIDMLSTVFKESQTQDVVKHDLKKRAIELYTKSVYPKIRDNKEIENSFETEKRRESRLRFTGMRGKKDNESEYMNSYPGEGTEKMESSVNEKRAEEWQGEKRDFLTFHGMRGKKLEDLDSRKIKSQLSNINSLSSIGRYLINDGLMNDMNVPETDYFEDVVTRQDKEEWNNIFSKRSPYFIQGLRGKIGNLYDFKRALGFMGMRGKKGTEVWSRYFGYKRVPQSSFFGMKGKKAQAGFFGMRGKKSEEGIQGKPISYDFQDSVLFDKNNDEKSPINQFQQDTWPDN